MAKKKKSRPTSSARTSSSSATTRTTTAKKVVDAPAVKPAAAEAGGPNRQARKEEARRQREALQRKIRRRGIYRRIGGAAVALAVVGGGVFLLTRSSPRHVSTEESKLLAQFDQASKAAGCSAVQSIGPYSGGEALDRAHIGTDQAPTPPPLSTYASTPPASGPHDQTPWPSGVVNDPPDIYRTIHSLEHGGVIVWLAPAASGDEVTNVQTFFSKSNESTKVIVAPYSYPKEGAAGQLPAGKQMVLVAWHRMMTCATPSLSPAFWFVDHYAARGQSDYEGVAPEPAAGIG